MVYSRCVEYNRGRNRDRGSEKQRQRVTGASGASGASEAVRALINNLLAWVLANITSTTHGTILH